MCALACLIRASVHLTLSLVARDGQLSAAITLFVNTENTMSDSHESLLRHSLINLGKHWLPRVNAQNHIRTQCISLKESDKGCYCSL